MLLLTGAALLLNVAVAQRSERKLQKVMRQAAANDSVRNQRSKDSLAKRRAMDSITQLRSEMYRGWHEERRARGFWNWKEMWSLYLFALALLLLNIYLYRKIFRRKTAVSRKP